MFFLIFIIMQLFIVVNNAIILGIKSSNTNPTTSLDLSLLLQLLNPSLSFKSHVRGQAPLKMTL